MTTQKQTNHIQKKLKMMPRVKRNRGLVGRCHFGEPNKHKNFEGTVTIEIDGIDVPNDITLVDLENGVWVIRAGINLGIRLSPETQGFTHLDIHYNSKVLSGPFDFPFNSREEAENYLATMAQYLESLSEFQYWVRRFRGAYLPELPVVRHREDVARLWDLFEETTPSRKREIEGFMRDYLSKSVIKTRVTVRGLIGILKDDYIKHYRLLPENQDFVKSGIVNERDVIDQRFHHGKPIYSFAEPIDCYNKSVDTYGGAEIVWKDRVKEGATVLFGDSLTDYAFLGGPVPISEPSFLGANPHYALQWQGSDDIQTQIRDEKFDYVEAHIVRWAVLKNIERVKLFNTNEMDGLQRDNLQRAIRELNRRHVSYEVK